MTAPLGADRLRWTCPRELLDFESTESLPDLDGVIGQERALRAVSFGIDIANPGYHMFALGSPGTGKASIVSRFLRGKAEAEPPPEDWVYVNNFEDPDRPRALSLPAGYGCGFRDDMDHLVHELETEVPRAFEQKEYQQRKEKLLEDLEERRKELFRQIEAKAKERGVAILQGPQGLAIAPMKDDQVLGPDEVAALPEPERRKLEATQKELHDQIRETMRTVQQLQREGKERSRRLDREVVAVVVDDLIEHLKRKYEGLERITEHLERVRVSILDNVDTLRKAQQAQQAQGGQGGPEMAAMMMAQMGSPFGRYRANLIVDHCAEGEDERPAGAPVVCESNPTYANLVGRIEHRGQFGTLVTDFSLIKAGALHRANGGYLVVDAFEILTKPLAWDVLKRSLKNREIRIEPMGAAYGFLTTRTLEPEPIPLKIKVVINGDPRIYYLLYNLDPDFRELFKVKVDFAEQTERQDESVRLYARFIGSTCRERDLRHFSPSGVAKVVEHAAREVSHQEKLGVRFGDLVDLLQEASYWAGEAGSQLVEGEHVRRALEEKIHRSNRIEERLREMITEGTILVDTEGAVVGQVNGLSVLSLGDYAFGKPTRVTARTYVGTGGVVNIDRETEMGGRIHNKGTMILAGYLGGKYAREAPLALAGSIVFEQLYEGVEGDSASSTELYALLSSLADLPIRQDLAVTGSVNQRGEVQAIGGVNQKIEGFFDICRLRGLTGDQGVLVPRDNVKHLMLREDVVEAAREGKFQIHAVATIDEGIALLTGTAAGEPDEAGEYPADSVNGRVQRRLRELAEKVKEFARKGKPGELGPGPSE